VQCLGNLRTAFHPQQGSGLLQLLTMAKVCTGGDAASQLHKTMILIPQLHTVYCRSLEFWIDQSNSKSVS